MLSERDILIGKNLSACHRCPRAQQGCRGPCACTIDGVDIIAHSEAGDCPEKKHQPLPSRGLGDTVAKIAKATGADAAARMFEHLTGKDCGCARRREKLNALAPYGGNR